MFSAVVENDLVVDTVVSYASGLFVFFSVMLLGFCVTGGFCNQNVCVSDAWSDRASVCIL